MSKIRLFYTIISLIIILFCSLMIIIDSINYSLYLIISLSGLFLIFYMRIIELAKLNRIKHLYFTKCQPRKYLEEHQILMNSFWLTRKQSIATQLFNISVLLSFGEIHQAKSILNELSIKISKLSNVELYWLLVGWFNYFEEINDFEKTEIFFLKICDLNYILPHGFKQRTENNFKKMQARYFIQNGIYLDNAETIFTDSLKNRRYFINVLNSLFFLGLTAYKQNKKEVALERLNFVVQTKLSDLSIYQKAKILIEQISNEPTI